MKRANSFNTGVAAEYFILSQLYRQDIEAYISQGNKKAIDIMVVKFNNEAISIDVKSVRGYSSLVVNNIKPKKNHYIVFVIYNNKFNEIDTFPEVFIVPSLKISKITKSFGNQKRVMKKALSDYKNKWHYLR